MKHHLLTAVFLGVRVSTLGAILMLVMLLDCFASTTELSVSTSQSTKTSHS